MDESQKLVDTESLKLSKLTGWVNSATDYHIHYDDVVDDLMVLFVSPEQETVVHYIDNHMAVLYEPDSREIVGFQVEAFESAFIKMHNNVQSAWTIDVGSVTLNLAIDTVRKQQKLFVQELGNVARPKLQQRGLVYA